MQSLSDRRDARYLVSTRRDSKKTDANVGFVDGNLFAGGDFVSGPSTVIQAVAAGKETANLIESFLLGQHAPRLNVISVTDFVDSVLIREYGYILQRFPSRSGPEAIYTGRFTGLQRKGCRE